MVCGHRRVVPYVLYGKITALFKFLKQVCPSYTNVMLQNPDVTRTLATPEGLERSAKQRHKKFSVFRIFYFTG
jgi:hypothetical protein